MARPRNNPPSPRWITLWARNCATRHSRVRGYRSGCRLIFHFFPTPLTTPSAILGQFFNQLDPVSFADAMNLRMPAESYDQQAVSAHGGPAQFITAAQCNGCHNATPKTHYCLTWCLWRTNRLAPAGCATFRLTANGEYRRWVWPAATRSSFRSCRARPTIYPRSQPASRTPVSIVMRSWDNVSWRLIQRQGRRLPRYFPDCAAARSAVRHAFEPQRAAAMARFESVRRTILWRART